MNPSKKYLCGILGFPLGHTASPSMHQAAFRALNLDGDYFAFPVMPSQLKKAVEAVRYLNVCGVNVTIPFKEKVIRFLDEISPEAEMMGAVNTILNSEGRLTGFNTDGYGFQKAFESGLKKSLRGMKLILIGAGGAARAVAVQCALSDVRELVIVNRSKVRLKSLIQDLKKSFPSLVVSGFSLDHPGLKKEFENAGGVVNATSLGMSKNDLLPAPVDWLIRDLRVYDLVYRPFETSWVKLARKKGCRAVGGYEMLLHQGARSFEIWTQRKAPLEPMRAALLKQLGVKS
jgi:shikimate dehydrogenase